MKKQSIENVLGFYYDCNNLKEVERTGWKNWNVSKDKRIESIAEHTYGTEALAIAIYCEFDIDIDIFKVVTMLSLHETEEIKIGDKTPFDNITEKEKLEMGKEAVDDVCKPLKNKVFIVSLIDEFNERKTKEAKFAYLCDKLECDLQAKKYSDEGRTTIKDAKQDVINDSRVQEIISNGAKTVSDVFIEYDKPKYASSEIFSDIINFLNEYEIERG